jgi:ABC-type uncharacterized transport system substrate-binding protein
MALALAAMGTGLVLAYYLGLAAGASVVLTALVLFALTGPLRRLRAALSPAAVALAVLGAAAPASAHPHVWVDYTITVRFTPEGPDGVRVNWGFDEMISALVIQKYDTDRDGTLSAHEIRVIEKELFVSLKEFDYFVALKVDGVAIPVKEFKDFEARNARGQLHYLFTVPIRRAARNDGTVDVLATDPTFYSAFSAVAAPITAEGASRHRVECAPLRDRKTNLVETLRCTYRRRAR